MPEETLTDYWRDLGYPRRDCRACGTLTNADGSPVLWRCGRCGHLVCQQCARLIPNQPGRPEYHHETLCSEACWIAAGKPDE
jgi:hypothetical protein